MTEKWLRWPRPRHKAPSPSSPPASTRRPATAQALYASLVKEALSPAFRDLGFKGSGGRYSLPCPDCWALLAIQRSTYSTSTEVRFTINLLVLNKATWAQHQQAQPHLPKHPTASTFYGTWAPQTRIGQLVPGEGDKWWKLSSERHLKPIADEVVHDVREYALPWMHHQLLNQHCRTES